VSVHIEGATRDDLAEIIASADALVASDAGHHDPAATDLTRATRTGSASATSLLAGDDNLVLLARDVETVTGHLIGRPRGPGSGQPIRVAELEASRSTRATGAVASGAAGERVPCPGRRQGRTAGLGNRVRRQRGRTALLRPPGSTPKSVILDRDDLQNAESHSA